MDPKNSIAVVNPNNVDHLTKSLERLSIFDAKGKVKVLKLSPKTDFLKILGNLDLETIEAQVFVKKTRAQGSRNGGYRSGRPRLCRASSQRDKRTQRKRDSPKKLHHYRAEPAGGKLNSSRN